ncbi:MAG: hypothetical protein A2176_00485 [Spirochaetes bacterium RBG_13_51_14]|nr:MAG: hypothetical protein A2176_00485 [Spirochaetes bacterium RBG_13_51_14]
MEHEDTFRKIQESSLKHDIMWSIHTSERMIERQITSTGVIHVLLNGKIIEEYETNIIVFGWYDNKPIHVVCFYNENEKKAFITSVYHPDEKHFESDFKTRRKR